MKKLYALILALCLLLAGCGQSQDTKSGASTEYQMGRDFKNYLIENYPSDKNGLIWDTDDFMVNVNAENTVTVTIRAGEDTDIPDLIEVMVPLVETALAEFSMELERLTINSYDEKSTDGTLVDWHTYDLVKGNFSSAKDDNYIKMDITVDEVRDFFEKRANEQKSEAETNNSQSTSRTVYVTATGDKYHYSSTCNGGTYTPTTLDKAKARGLTPCGKCVD